MVRSARLREQRQRAAEEEDAQEGEEDRGGQEEEQEGGDRSVVLADEVLSSTGLDAREKASLEEMVTLMGGELRGVFDGSMCALVAAGVGSEKYQAALRWDVPVVSMDWVKTCFEEGRLAATDLFLVKPFHKMSFSVTGFAQDPELRGSIMKGVQDNGGSCSASMQPDTTTHLVAESFTGAKCEATVSHPHIKVVSAEWVWTCIRSKRYVSEEGFLVKSDDVEERRRKQKEDKAALKRQRASEEAEKVRQQRVKERALEALMHREAAALRGVSAAGTWLDVLQPLSIFLHGFDSKRWRTVQALVRCTGATVLWEWNKTATHILVGNRVNDDYVNVLQQLHPDLPVLHTDYILECIDKKRRPAVKRRRLNQAAGDGASRRGMSKAPKGASKGVASKGVASKGAPKGLKLSTSDDRRDSNGSTKTDSISRLSSTGTGPGKENAEPQARSRGKGGAAGAGARAEAEAEIDLDAYIAQRHQTQSSELVRAPRNDNLGVPAMPLAPASVPAPLQPRHARKEPTRLRPQKVQAVVCDETSLVCVSRYVGDERARVQALATYVLLASCFDCLCSDSTDLTM